MTACRHYNIYDMNCMINVTVVFKITAMTQFLLTLDAWLCIHCQSILSATQWLHE